MALINCPRCGKEISDRGKICPHCRLVLNEEWEHPLPAKPGKSDIIIALIFALITIGLFALGKWMYPYSGWLLFVILGIAGAIITVVAAWWHIDMVTTYNLSQSNPDAYRQLMVERQIKLNKLEDELRKQDAEKMSAKYNHYRYKCPMCGSNKIMNLSTAKKAVSAEAFGLGSKTIGKCYQCDDCKYMW